MAGRKAVEANLSQSLVERNHELDPLFSVKDIVMKEKPGRKKDDTEEEDDKFELDGNFSFLFSFPNLHRKWSPSSSEAQGSPTMRDPGIHTNIFQHMTGHLTFTLYGTRLDKMSQVFLALYFCTVMWYPLSQHTVTLATDRNRL